MEKNFVTFDREKLTINVNMTNGQELTIGKGDVEISYFSSGSGGQNLNRHLKGVRLIYKIPENHRMPMRTQEIVTRVIGKRSRHHNLLKAFEQLFHKLTRYFYIPEHREKTQVPKGSKEKRLQNKKLQSQKKEARKKNGLRME